MKTETCIQSNVSRDKQQALINGLLVIPGIWVSGKTYWMKQGKKELSLEEGISLHLKQEYGQNHTQLFSFELSNHYDQPESVKVLFQHRSQYWDGGFSPSLFDNTRQAVISSRMLDDGVNPSLPAEKRGVPNSRITINEAFYFATAGGGESLSLPIGRLAENYAWDVQIIDTTIASAKLPIYSTNEDLFDVFQKIMYLARPENIREVWVQGEKVHSRM